MAHSLEAYKTLLEKKQPQLLEDYFTFLKFQSISTKPEHQADIRACANWVADYLKKAHFKTQIWETTGHPCVYAENCEAGPDKPTLLFYHHYDVQPVDPLELWQTPPFEPTLKGDQVFARGASDNKGQAFFVFTALNLLFEKQGKYPINIKLLVEGEEEIGSTSLEAVLDQHRDELKTDYLTTIDVDIPAEKVPAINLSTRGILTYTLKVQGSNTDLHSGIHGGLVYNPLRALSEALSSMYNEKGEVTCPAFYEGLLDISPSQREQLYLDFDKKEYKAQYNATANGGEHAFSPLERTGLRPTFEINGLWGGYNEEGFKTVIPAEAFAKLSIRLVPNQDPQKVAQNFERYFPTLFPEGMRIELTRESEPAEAFLCPFESQIVDAASEAYETVFNVPCKKIMGGGSLPIASLLQKKLKAQALAFGLGLSSDKIHAPNEHFSISRVNKGALIVTQFVENLAQLNIPTKN